MAYYNPSGVIELFKGINLDNRYMHTLYFETEANQKTFFDSFVNQTLKFTEQSYTRVNAGHIRIRVNAETVQNVTYMRFNNRNNKWYYCFVNAINYVNENTTDIFYEIDVMQTWFFQTGHKVNPCYVKREHVPISEDKLKKHLEPEPISTDVYRFDDITPSSAGSFGGYNVVVNTTNEVTNVENMYKDGIVCGTEYWSEQISGHLGDIARHMRESLGSWDKNEQSADITDFYMFPTKYVNQNTESYGVKMFGGNQETPSIVNYNPDNKKLHSYPYSFLFATTKGGESAQYRWEYFDQDATAGGELEFHVDANSTGGGCVVCYPKDYNGITDNIDAKIACNDFPKCSWSFDAYQAFVANGGTSKLQAAQKLQDIKATVVQYSYDAADVATTVAAGARTATMAELTAATGGLTAPMAVEAAAKTTAQIANTTGNIASRYVENKEAQNKIDFAFKDARYAPDISVGQQIPNITVGTGILGFYFFNCHVDPMEMVRLDNFLTLYGYSVNTVKVPQLTGRAFWNFVQTEACQVKGDMPASSKEAIGRILDGGIFFWKSTGTPATANDNIGNFMQSVTAIGDFGTQIHNR